MVDYKVVVLPAIMCDWVKDEIIDALIASNVALGYTEEELEVVFHGSGYTASEVLNVIHNNFGYRLVCVCPYNVYGEVKYNGYYFIKEEL